MIGGVCSGLAEYFNIDPVLIRLLFVILTLHHGIGILAYVILWIVVPQHLDVAVVDIPSAEDTLDETFSAPHEGTGTQKAEGKGSFIGGIVLIAIGVLFLLDNFIPSFGFDDFWPVLLVAIGAAMLWNSWSDRSTNENEVAS
jgi:phage shock protein PspC (stress-responsive transcriptional regulator)